MGDRPKHPSGRPIHRRIVKERSKWNIPDEGPVTPRLQTPRKDLHLMGFQHHEPEYIEEDDE